ncbi:hypothetical protein BH09GEM1_BH09GEM1_09700 [soil metagenome]
MLHLLLLSCTVALPVPPIVRRHDRPDSAYIALARRFKQVGSFGRIGDATLIAPKWAITAAHVARGMASRMAHPALTIGGRTYPVANVFIHAAWTDHGLHDIALVELSKPVAHVTPAHLYTKADEARQIAFLVGNGKTGTGNARARTDDDVWRAATTRVDSTSATVLYLSFDAPPGGTELEGGPSAGDSGGPALLSEGGSIFVAGISSGGFDGANGPASYGAVDEYTRVSAHKPWADSVMAGRIAPTRMVAAPVPVRGAAPSRNDTPADTVLPATAPGQRARAFIRAMRTGSDSAILSFLNVNYARSELADRPAEARLPNFRRLAELLKGTRLLMVRNGSATSITLELSTASDKPVTIELLCESAEPHGIVDWRRFD